MILANCRTKVNSSVVFHDFAILLFILSNSEVFPSLSSTDNEILEHLNAEGKKIYSHLHKFKTHQTSTNKSKERSKVLSCSSI